jgi:hypothetical protein
MATKNKPKVSEAQRRKIVAGKVTGKTAFFWSSWSRCQYFALSLWLSVKAGGAPGQWLSRPR